MERREGQKCLIDTDSYGEEETTMKQQRKKASFRSLSLEEGGKGAGGAGMP